MSGDLMAFLAFLVVVFVFMRDNRRAALTLRDDDEEYLRKLQKLDLEVLELMFKRLTRIHDVQEDPDVDTEGSGAAMRPRAPAFGFGAPAFGFGAPAPRHAKRRRR